MGSWKEGGEKCRGTSLGEQSGGYTSTITLDDLCT